MSDIWIPDHVIIRLVDDIDHSLTRSRYEEVLIEFQLYSISTLRDDPDYADLNKREMIARTLQEKCNWELLVALHERRILSNNSYRALSNLGYEFGQSIAGDLADPIEETSRLESELRSQGMEDVRSFMEQSLDNYADGNYEAANAMTRTALERLVQIIANKINGMRGNEAIPQRGRYLSPSDYRNCLHNTGFLDDAEARLRKFVLVGISLLFLEKLNNREFIASLVQ